MPIANDSSKFTAKIMKTDGSFEISTNDDSESYVDRFVPNDVREFFFFDGERLDRYFKEATGQKIRRSIYKISQTSLLGRMEENLKKVQKEYESDAGKNDGNVELTRSLLNDVEKRMNDLIKTCKENEDQATAAKEKVKELNIKVRDFPEVEGLKKELDELKNQKNEKKGLMSAKMIEKQEQLYEYSKVIYFYPSISKSIEVIMTEEQAGNYPPTFDRSLIEEIIKEKKCRICGTKFTEGSEEEKFVKIVLSRIELSTEVAKVLQKMEHPLNEYIDKIGDFKKKFNAITKEINQYNTDIQKIETGIQKIEIHLKGFNQEKVKQWYQELYTYGKLYEENNQAVGIKKQKISELKDELEQLKNQLDREISRNKKMSELQKKIHFVKKAIDIVDSTKSKVMNEIKNKISESTERDFFSLMWKKESFREVKIDDNYDIKLIHKDGYECLGSISGGEREILALSFTMALHKISGFDAPILIDRPFAMVSGEPIDHVADILLSLSKEKQLILFLTPNDYDNVSHILNNSNCTLYEIKLSTDEKEIKLGGF
jgi:DNA sulfur modification protein DndD